MNKRRLHHFWRTMRWIQPWYFLVIGVASSVICVYALRANNEHMVVLRQAVYTADQKNVDVEGALKALQAYVTTHMNTNLSAGPNSVYPPIQLKYTYDRLVNEESAKAAEANTHLYTAAQNYCQAKIPTGFSGRYRVACIEKYVQTHDTSLPVIEDALYKFDFVSPIWSPDKAGWSMVIAAFSLVLFIVTWVGRRWLKHTVG
ncbi:MAG TPA: hypothetical protein VG604_00275 [Candidatus Saccharimonadales bacterium]|nr:hypothetical protein [Candidatus Saccharimonadales bacterium]